MLLEPQIRLKKLLDTNQINQAEYDILIASIYNKPKLIIRVFKFLVNPFESASTWFYFIIGILIVATLSYLCYITDFLGQGNKFHPHNQISYLFAIKCISILWLCPSCIFIIISLLFGAKKIRIIDFLVFCGIAIFPFFMVILLDSISYLINPKFINPNINETNLIVIIYSGILDTIAVLFMFWYIILNFFAFKISSGLNQHRTWFGFVIAMIITKIVLTIWLTPFL